VIDQTGFGPGPGATRIYLIAGAFTVAGVKSSSSAASHTDWLASLVIAIAGCLIGLFLGFCARPLSRRYKSREQRKRDERAAAILAACREGRRREFSLYLRSFETTGRMPFEAEMMGVEVANNMGDDAVADFETSLAHAVENGAPMLALGRPGEQIGAGRILTTEEGWQGDLSLLAREATVIFLAPSTRPGTMWEIDWLIDARLLHKTIWVQPPTGWGSLRHALGKARFDWKAMWDQIIGTMQSKGLQPPPFDKRGTLFTFDNNGTLRVTSTLKGHAGARGLGAFLRKHLERMASLRKEPVAL